MSGVARVARRRASSGRDPAMLWLVSRAATGLAVLLPGEASVLADIRTYTRWAPEVLAGNFGVAPEYPLAGLATIAAPGLVSGHDVVSYLVAFMAMMLLVDAALTAALWRFGGESRGRALLVWLVVVPCMGPLALTRFDLLPAALTAGSLLMLARKPLPGAAGLGLAVAVKIWPVAALPAVLLPGGRRLHRTAAFVLPVLVASALTVWLAGLGRLVSPLSWQTHRGLQVESVPALPLMWLHVIDPQRWPIRYAHGAWEVSGPGGTALTVVAFAVLALGLAYAATQWRRAVRRAMGSAAAGLPAAGLIAAAVMSMVLVTSKNLSPQYLIWLGATLVAAVCLAGDRIGRLPLIGLLAACVMTQVVYPLAYLDLLGGGPLTLLVLTTRNMTLVAVSAALFHALARQVRQPTPRTVIA